MRGGFDISLQPNAASVGPQGPIGDTGPPGPGGGSLTKVNLTHADSPYTIVGAQVWLDCDTTAGDIVLNPRGAAANGDIVLITNVAGTHNVDATGLGGQIVSPSTAVSYGYDDDVWGGYFPTGGIAAAAGTDPSLALATVLADGTTLVVSKNGANPPTLHLANPTAWANVQGGVGYQNGWLDLGVVGGTDYGLSRYSKYADGSVELQVNMTAGSAGAAFTLPAGFRPGQGLGWTASDDSGALADPAYGDVRADGNVMVLGLGSRGNARFTMRFRAEN